MVMGQGNPHMKKSFFSAAQWAMLAAIGATYVSSAHDAVGETASPQVAPASGSTALPAPPPQPQPPPLPPPQPPPFFSHASHGGSTKPFAFGSDIRRPDLMPSISASCGFINLHLPKRIKIFALQGSGIKQNFQIDQSGEMATQADVAVNEPSTPVVLILGNHAPTIWNIGWTRGTHVIAVIAGGYGQQILNGLSPDVAVRSISGTGKDACSSFLSPLDRENGVNPVSRQVFGQPVDMLYPVKDGKVVAGEPLPAHASLVTDDSARQPASFQIPKSDWAGPPALAEAAQAGYLRPAADADADAWLAAEHPSSDDDDLPPNANGSPKRRLFVMNGYVVLKAYTLPKGLYGTHAATFFVPKGIPRPSGDPGHSTIYDFNTGECIGVICRARAALRSAGTP
jgi:hypothetical protein